MLNVNRPFQDMVAVVYSFYVTWGVRYSNALEAFYYLLCVIPSQMHPTSTISHCEA